MTSRWLGRTSGLGPAIGGETRSIKSAQAIEEGDRCRFVGVARISRGAFVSVTALPLGLVSCAPFASPGCSAFSPLCTTQTTTSSTCAGVAPGPGARARRHRTALDFQRGIVDCTVRACNSIRMLQQLVPLGNWEDQARRGKRKGVQGCWFAGLLQ